MTWSAGLPLVGAGGEPVDLRRTIASHGVADLPPNRIDEDAVTLETTIRLPRGRPRIVRVAQGPQAQARVTVLGRPPAAATADVLLAQTAHILRLDEDLSEFYGRVREDPDAGSAFWGRFRDGVRARIVELRHCFGPN